MLHGNNQVEVPLVVKPAVIRVRHLPTAAGLGHQLHPYVPLHSNGYPHTAAIHKRKSNSSGASNYTDLTCKSGSLDSF